MGKNRNIDNVLAMINAMSQREKSALAEEIWNMLNDSTAPSPDEEPSCARLVQEARHERPNCPHCGAKASLGNIVKSGMHRGAQRYRCKACGSKFVSTTGTTFARTKKDADTWRKFISLTISGASLKECAVACGICYQTAFTWRHKVLNVFSVNQESTKMTGRVEVDDMFFPVSFKGNHIKGYFGKRDRPLGSPTVIPRKKALRRGSDNRSNVNARACVLCMVQNQNRGFFAAVPGLGAANSAMLNATIGKHVDKERAYIYSDNHKNNITFLEANKYTYRTFASNTSDNPHDHKPEIDGDEHIQNVNAMHTGIRRFMKKYMGVSTKYLSNYVSLYVWLRNIAVIKQRTPTDEVTATRASASDCYISRKEIENRPAIPCCA